MSAERALAFVLHAHLPWCKGEPDAEGWFCEAVAGCYLPLLELFGALSRGGVRAPAALSLSPTLLAMLDDPSLRAQARAHLVRQAEGQEAVTDPALLGGARFQALRSRQLLALFDAVRGDLPAAFGALAREGALELFTCAATHGYLPLLAAVPAAVRAQVAVGAGRFKARFGAAPRGMWLPECGYTPGVEAHLAAAGVRWFVVDGPAFGHASPPPLAGVRSHVFLDNGVAAFARDEAACERVWSKESGYPGHPDYLDFHHQPQESLKLHRVTGLGEKAPWEPDQAFARARAHAAMFFEAVEQGRAGLTVAAFDAELFGHWWHEGPAFLDAVLRRCAASSSVRAMTPSGWLRASTEAELATLSPSSWGRGGFHSTWLSEANHRFWPPLTRAAERLVRLASANAEATGERAELLGRLATELLLAQSSDWPFLLDAGASTALAARRVEGHLAAALRCAGAALEGDWAPLRALGGGDAPLGQVDFRLYRT